MSVHELRVAVTAPDYDEALAFYRDVLGLREREAFSSEDGRVTILEAGREPLVFSLMTGCVVGSDRAELHERIRRLLAKTDRDGDPEAFVRERRDVFVVGTVDEVVERLTELERQGVERVFLQHLVHEDVDMVRLLGAEVVPAVA